MRRLPANELDALLKQLHNTRLDQERAKILATCGWTQQELAERMGKNQSWVARQMLFGRFLAFMPNGIKAINGGSHDSMPPGIDIREGTFRAAWDRTDKSADDEAARLAAVCQILAEEADRKAETKPSKMVAATLMGLFADGKWHPLDGIAAKLDVHRDVVVASLQVLPRAPYHAKVEHKTVGIRPHYRIFHADKMIRLSELIEKLGPTIDELVQEGKKNMATISVGTVAHCAAILKRQVDEWSK